MRRILVIGLFFLAVGGTAQISQTARWERELKNSSHNYTVITMGNQGIAMVHDKQKYEAGKRFWEIIALDTLLKEKWTREIFVDNRYNFIGHDYRDGYLYFLFRFGETDMGDLKIIKMGSGNEVLETHDYNPQVSVKLTHFNVMENKAILAGYVASEPAILLFDVSTDQGKIVPGLFVKNTQMLDARVNVNNTFNVVLSESPSKVKKKLVIKTFDHAGTLLLDDAIEVETNKTILSAVTSTLIRDELLIAGTWSEGIGQQAAGFFTVTVDPYSDQKINYYDFVQLNRFLDYLTPKRQAKTKAKAERRRNQGKLPDYRVGASAVRVEETPKGFLFLMEAYSSTSQLNNYNRGFNNPFYGMPYPYGFYPGVGYPYRLYNSPYYYNSYAPGFNNTGTVEIKMLQTSIVALDAKGNLLSDHGCKLNEIKTISSDQLSDFVESNDKITIVASKEKEIFWQLSQNDGLPLTTDKNTIQLNSTIETIRSDDDAATVRHWYNKQMMVYGYQTIKNPERGNRDVFFINKISVQ